MVDMTTVTSIPRARLRGYNLGMGALHAIQGVIVLLLANDFTLPVVATYMTGIPGASDPSIEPLFDVSIAWGVAIFLFMSAVAHLTITLPGVFPWYLRNLESQRNYARWIEYSFSSSVMVVLIAMLVGISDIAALIAIAGVNASMILFGLLLGWLTPIFLNTTSGKIQSQAWPSLGWGAIAWAAFFFALLLIVIIMIAGGIIFGVLTLGGVSGTIIWLGILSMFALIVTFVLATAYVSKIVVGTALGKWIFNKFNPALAEHKFWPMIVGVVIVAVVVGLFKFPLLPLGFFGWLLNFAVVLFGLGALWLWGRERLSKQPAG